MFYNLIEKKSNKWYESNECTVSSLIKYIEGKGELRDAQIEAIKVYLYLKIGCNNKSLYDLFSSGHFNTIDLDHEDINSNCRNFLIENQSAASLYEYASLKTENGILSQKIIEIIKSNPESLDYDRIFKDLFYNVSYTDYLFSLPMGAGKTYLMACFIYLDLYFALNEPDNKNFAHNFVIFAPSGLKNSVVPSLRTIEKFDPSWILPEPSASNIKNRLIFEVLDQNSTSNKSNKIKNPNVQKIAIHQPLSELFGFVAVTNAEKVILNRVNAEERNGQIVLDINNDDDEDRMANELRNLIGKIPSLSIFIDEVHHAQDSDIKLRAVVNHWIENYGNINSIIGFSGTPYLQTKNNIVINDDLTIKQEEISNIVYYYPLVNGIGNFLKKPEVIISNSNDKLDIVCDGVKEFFNRFKDSKYNDGTLPKLAIYCGRIDTLEEEIYPLVEQIVSDYSLDPNQTILKYHGGNDEYKVSTDAEYLFSTLDSSLSKIRVVLLAQIGREGWDCKSLTSVILPREDACSRNMVLQTSCRCLRQVDKNKLENAIIFLNDDNAKILDSQLRKQHKISINEFETGIDNNKYKLNRYNRMNRLKVPEIDFYQLVIKFNTIIVDDNLNIEENIKSSLTDTNITSIISRGEFSNGLNINREQLIDEEKGSQRISFNNWLLLISKESYYTISIKDLLPYKNILLEIFNKITFDDDNYAVLSSKYDQYAIRSNIRKSFSKKRQFNTTEESIPTKASILNLDNFTSEVFTDTPESYYPPQNQVDIIVANDKNSRSKEKKKLIEAISALENLGDTKNIVQYKEKLNELELKDRTYHYLPYFTDSYFEILFFNELLKNADFIDSGLEIYYNGDSSLTNFHIKCYKKINNVWNYIGIYTPDFLLIERKNEEIYKIAIIETKGAIYKTEEFVDKMNFTKDYFISSNNNAFGYSKFTYMYIEDSMLHDERLLKVTSLLNSFFKED